jgi:endonuclease III related protein
MTPASREEQIRDWYGAMFGAWGRQHWWPAQSRFEVIVGAFLTQNTAWTNVERAIANLRRARSMSLKGIRATPITRLEELVRPSGYFSQKALRLKNFVRFLDDRYQGSLRRMFARPTAELREELLALNGIGPETADSILLYAGRHTVFVVDAYTRRILHRHGILPLTADYEKIRSLFERALRNHTADSLATRHSKLSTHNGTRIVPRQPALNSPLDTRNSALVSQRYNEMHGLIVNAGKYHCHKAQAKCEGCPLQPFLPASGPRGIPRPSAARASEPILAKLLKPRVLSRREAGRDVP